MVDVLLIRRVLFRRTPYQKGWLFSSAKFLEGWDEEIEAGGGAKQSCGHEGDRWLVQQWKAGTQYVLLGKPAFGPGGLELNTALPRKNQSPQRLVR